MALAVRPEACHRPLKVGQFFSAGRAARFLRQRGQRREMSAINSTLRTGLCGLGIVWRLQGLDHREQGFGVFQVVWVEAA
jgi:hypothetical protein